MRYAYTITNSTIAYRDILILTLAPQTENDMVLFEPGQYVALGFKRYGKLSPMRCFTVASSPTDQTLQIAMRISGKFTRAAASLKTGTVVYVQGPFGEFNLTQASGHIVMLAGGIGITPFMSMLRYANATRLNMPMTLVYTNRIASEIPFYDELLSLEKSNPLLKIAFFASQGEGAGRIISGQIQDKHIAQLTTGPYAHSTYFLCGPQKFMDAMEGMLMKNDVLPDQIVTESFAQSNHSELNEKFSTPVKTYALAFAMFALIAGSITLYDVHKTTEAAEATAKVTSAQTTSATDTSATPIDTSATSTVTPVNSDTSNASSTPAATSTTTTPTTTPAPVTTYQRPVSRAS